MYDFSTTKVRCSAIYGLMSGSNRKTSMQLYLEACDEIVAKQARYDAMKKKDGVNGFKLIADVQKLAAIIPILESQKDVELPLSEGTKSFLTSLYSLVKYNKQAVFKDRGNKFTQKGKEAEEQSIKLVSILEGKLFYKHEGRQENPWIAGHPDVLDKDDEGNVVRVIDVKTPWDAENFFSLLGKELSPQYYWQMQGYLALNNCYHGEVHFCLIDQPQHFIKNERERLLRSMDVISELSPEFVEAEKRLINNMTFGDIAPNERRLVYKVERNDDELQKVYKQVEKAREYLIEIEKMHLGMESFVSLMRNDAE